MRLPRQRVALLAAAVAVLVLAGGAVTALVWTTGDHDPAAVHRRPGPAAATTTMTPPATAAPPPAPPPASPAAVRLPPAHAVFDYQIGGAYPPAAAAAIVDRDHHESPVAGRYNICYVNGFQTQPEENSWWVANHPNLLLRDGGGYVEDPDWPGERVLDVTTPAKRAAIAGVLDGWFAECARKGFQAAEPDNLDSWTRSHHLVSQADGVAMARLLVAGAHARGLAVAQKNTPELGSAGRAAIGFDFAIAEECSVYAECAKYMAVYGPLVYEIEYTDNGVEAFQKACSDHGGKISILLRDRDVTPVGNPAYHNQAC
jgi:hypothetical protein